MVVAVFGSVFVAKDWTTNVGKEDRCEKTINVGIQSTLSESLLFMCVSGEWGIIRDFEKFTGEIRE